MSSKIIKNDGFLTVTVDTKVGYVIRLNDYNGVTFTVDEDNNVHIGQNGRKSYKYVD